jgi:hypothetical protein
MGCDIHLHREVRDADGAWHLMGSLNEYMWEEEPLNTSSITMKMSRNYGLFGALSRGVRVDTDYYLGADYDLHEDTSAEVVKSYREWDQGAHSANTATLRQLDKLWKDSGKKIMALDEGGEKGYDTELDFFFEDWVDENLRPWARLGDDSVRIVYWFDN